METPLCKQQMETACIPLVGAPLGDAGIDALTIAERVTARHNGFSVRVVYD